MCTAKHSFSTYQLCATLLFLKLVEETRGAGEIFTATLFNATRLVQHHPSHKFPSFVFANVIQTVDTFLGSSQNRTRRFQSWLNSGLITTNIPNILQIGKPIAESVIRPECYPSGFARRHARLTMVWLRLR